MSDVLERWPPGRPVGLLALTAATAKDPEELFARLPGARRFWSATAENADTWSRPSARAPHTGITTWVSHMASPA